LGEASIPPNSSVAETLDAVKEKEFIDGDSGLTGRRAFRPTLHLEVELVVGGHLQGVSVSKKDAVLRSEEPYITLGDGPAARLLDLGASCGFAV
jgi:hypothetical protein